MSLAHTFNDASAPTKKVAQFYSMLGTRSVWYEGWHASTVHPAMGGWGGFERDRWELFDMNNDRSQAIDLADKFPEKVEELKTLWAMLAGKYQGLPLDNRTAVEVIGDERPRPGKPRSRYVYYPDCEPVPQGVAVSVTQRSFEVVADVSVADRTARRRHLRAGQRHRRSLALRQGGAPQLRLQLARRGAAEDHPRASRSSRASTKSGSASKSAATTRTRARWGSPGFN